MSSHAVDIILPCYNPPKDWSSKVSESFNYIKEAFPAQDIGLIIVNDGSTRGFTVNIKEQLEKKIRGVKIISYTKNRGKGYALREGVNASDKSIQIYTDIDFPYKEQNVVEMIRLLENQSIDIVIGIRDENYYRNIPWIRKVISKLLKLIIKTFLSIPTSDTQAGLKGFNARGKEVFLQTEIDRYLFDLEFIYLASKTSDLCMKLQQIRLKENVVFSHMNWKILFHEWGNFLRILLKR